MTPTLEISPELEQSLRTIAERVGLPPDPYVLTILQEARRILLGEHLDAASAGCRVGYDDVSQFSREYKRLFGQPPMRDVERLREAARR